MDWLQFMTFDGLLMFFHEWRFFMSQIKIGWSEVDITPKQKINLAGQFYERITNVAESPITVTGLAIESGEEQFIICSCDIAVVCRNLQSLVREKVRGVLPVSPDKIILHAVHNHTSYTYTEKDVYVDNSAEILERVLPEDMRHESFVSDDECMDPDDAVLLLAEKISEAVLLAWENRREGYYANAFGRAAVGFCRRVSYDDGTARMWGDTNTANFEALEGGNDSGIELLYTFDQNKKLTGVVANIACPAQIMEQRSIISADYWGKVKENLRKQYGENLKVLGLCSAAGDQCPRDLVRWVEPETPIDDPNVIRDHPLERNADPSMFDISGLKVVGRRIANEISAVFEEMPLTLKGEGLLIHETLEMKLPLRRVTLKERDEALEKINEFAKNNSGKSIDFKDEAALFIYAGTLARYEAQQKTELIPAEVHIVRLGDIAIATCPFELFLDYGNKIRARSFAKQTFLIQLACGSSGYLPTQKAEKAGHYSAYVSSGVTGHAGGDLLVREILSRINAMFEE